MKGHLLRITQLGEPVLRRKAKPLAPPFGRSTARLVADMLQTMKKARGVGIAAPQVGVGRRLFIVAPTPSVRYPNAPSLPPLAMLNPQLTRRSRSTEVGWEGCLSIPGIRARVPRYRWVEIRFKDLFGKTHRARLSGFVARIFQHEFDHINGQVYLDRVRDTRSFMTERQFRVRV